MTTKPSYTPALRFPDFLNDGEWEVKRLGDLFVRITDRNKENNKNVLTISAQFGLVNQFEYFSKNVAASDVTNYYIIQKGDFAYNKSRSQGYPFGAIKPLLLYDRGVVSTLYICFRLKEDSGCDADFYRFYFETGIINDQISNIAQEGARNHGLLNISTEDFFNINLIVPPLPEQRHIAQALTALDELIAATNEKLEQMKAYKKGLMQKLFPAEGKKLPELRFKEFEKDGEWEVKKLGEVAERITHKVGNANLRPVSISAGIGFVDQKNKFGRDISGNQYSNYIVLKKGEFAYNKGNSIKYPQGCVYKLKEFDVVACPSVFVCFRIIDENVCPDFLSAYFANNYHGIQLQQFITSGVRSNGLLNISAEDFFSIQIPFPPLPEQRKIASCLSAMDETINAYTEKVGLLGQFKKGLMQQMFVN